MNMFWYFLSVGHGRIGNYLLLIIPNDPLSASVIIKNEEILSQPCRQYLKRLNSTLNDFKI